MSWYAARTLRNARTRATVLIAVLAIMAVVVPPFAAAQDGTGVIVFESNRHGPTEIYSMRPDGSAPTRLTHNGVRDIAPVWAPDGTTIAFSRGRSNWELYRLGTGGGTQRLTRTPYDELNSEWSPDGSTIVFERQRQLGRRRDADIHVLEVATGRERAIARSPREEITPTWSPDGSRIAYAVRQGADFEIAVTDLASGDSTVITANRSDDVGPEWSPDGAMMAFGRLRGRDSALVVRTVATGRERTLETVVPAPFGPSWSPDGTAIVFAAPNPLDREIEGEYELYRLDLAGGDVHRLTTGFPGRDVSPDWSAGEGQALVARPALLQPPSFCTWSGGPGANWHEGDFYAADVLCGRGRGDTLFGHGGRDTLKGGTGDDRLYGGRGSDDLITRLDGPGDLVAGGRGADEAWIDCRGDRVRSAVKRCG